MATFQIPIKNQVPKNKNKKPGFFSFSVPEMPVILAGSRYLYVPRRICNNLIEIFSSLGFSFFIGCAKGVDACFRKALANSPFIERGFVACAFQSRLQYTYGIPGLVVVPENLHPRAALHRRTLWMVKRSCMAILFPEKPMSKTWGKGSTLVFNASLCHVKPVFVVTDTPPPDSIHYKVLYSDLFGVVQGYWVVPHPTKKGGTCDYEF